MKIGPKTGLKRDTKLKWNEANSQFWFTSRVKEKSKNNRSEVEKFRICKVAKEVGQAWYRVLVTSDNNFHSIDKLSLESPLFTLSFFAFVFWKMVKKTVKKILNQETSDPYINKKKTLSLFLSHFRLHLDAFLIFLQLKIRPNNIKNKQINGTWNGTKISRLLNVFFGGEKLSQFDPFQYGVGHSLRYKKTDKAVKKKYYTRPHLKDPPFWQFFKFSGAFVYWILIGCLDRLNEYR